MYLAGCAGGAIGLSLLLACTSATAGQQSYTYVVIHPFYGEIGSFTRTSEQVADTTRINIHLRVAIKLLGAVAYREEADGTEVLRGDRLVSLQNVTHKNGTQIEVRGESQGNTFVVSSPSGTFVAPADVAPSDPWFVNPTGPREMVSTKTGKVEHARVSDGENTTISLEGVSVTVRHFSIVSDNRQDVWLDDHNVPLMFRTEVDGTRIDFMLRTSLTDRAFASENSQ
jgi:Family of unknown function (DUF6134)